MRGAVVLFCFFLHGIISYRAVASVERMIETFDGNGDYTSVDGSIVGLDNPEWRTVGDGELRDGGFAMENVGPIVFGQVSDELYRPVVGLGSFVERIEIDSLFFGELCDFPCENPAPPGSQSKLALTRRLDLDGEGFNGLRFTFGESISTPDDLWDVSIFVTGTHEPGESNFRAEVERGTHIAIELNYDETSSETSIMYDRDVDDELPGVMFGPFAYGGTRSLTSETNLVLYAIAGGVSNGVVDHWSILPLSNTEGDFDHNGILDAADIDQLSAQVRAGSIDLFYDLNADSVVDDLDRQTWVHDLKSTHFGDADLNGTFDSTDLVQVLASGEYEDDDELNSTWLTGDWNGDGEFNSSDLVVALADGGYQAGPAVAAVPEPSGTAIALAAAAVAPTFGRRYSKTRRT